MGEGGKAGRGVEAAEGQFARNQALPRKQMDQRANGPTVGKKVDVALNSTDCHITLKEKATSGLILPE